MRVYQKHAGDDAKLVIKIHWPYAQLHYNICTHYLFMYQARLQVEGFSARRLSIRHIKRLLLSEGLGTLQ